MTAGFEWDIEKDLSNQLKHGVSFETAKQAFSDVRHVIILDDKHSEGVEKRYYCYGKVGDKVLTVRFVLRDGVIRIFGAGWWRKGRKLYEAKNSLH